MAAPSTSSIIRVPGTVTFAGTALGTCRDKTFEPNPIFRRIHDEVWGTTRDVIYCGEVAVFKCVVRYPDAGAVAAIFPNNSGSGWSFTATTASKRAGLSLGTRSGSFVFTPRYASHPTLTMYNAIPMPDEAVRIQLSLGEEYGLAMVFHGSPDSSGRVYAWT